jgi:hypothetical protein
MDKLELMVLGLSASPAGGNAYALILKEVDGSRRLPIIIGAFEAQAIALELEGVIPPRPLTHDLFKNFIDASGSTVLDVEISDLQDGTFYARVNFENPDIELDARPSDAIAVAVRFKVPIYVNSNILEETGLTPQQDEMDMDENLLENQYSNPKAGNDDNKVKTPLTQIDKLQMKLDKAITDEDYELAASIRDEIKKILESS